MFSTESVATAQTRRSAAACFRFVGLFSVHSVCEGLCVGCFMSSPPGTLSGCQPRSIQGPRDKKSELLSPADKAHHSPAVVVRKPELSL